MSKTIKIGALLLIVATIFCSCTNNSDFHGGVLLDSGKMSEIKSEVFATENTESGNVSDNDETLADSVDESDTDKLEATDTIITETVDKTETGRTTETASKATEEGSETGEHKPEYTSNADEMLSDTEENSIVYWAKSGEVWHTSRDCRYIRNSEVESGVVEDAMEAGKDRLCSSCGK